jgi:hypothetical protein
MDGGRVLRALLGYRVGFVRATRQAVRIGRVFAFAFILFGVVWGHMMLLLIGFFVLVTGSQEERAVRWRALTEKLRPGGVILDEDGRPIDSRDPTTPLDALRDALASGDIDGLRDFIERTRTADPDRKDGEGPVR